MSMKITKAIMSMSRKALCVATAATLVGATGTAAVAENSVGAEARRPTVVGQLHGMKNSIIRLRKAVEALQQNSTTVSSNVTDVKNSLSTLNQRVSSGTVTGASTAPTATPTQTPTPTPAPVIASSAATSTWIAFDKYQGRRGQVVVQHNNTGIVLSLKIMEAGKSVQEYKLNFPFAGRTADQKAADAMVINNCMTQFTRVFDAPDGTFFVNASTDDSLGILCASETY